jgi:hypothetical protein
MHKKLCKSETNVNFNADKITLSAKGREDANYELTFTAQTKAEEKAFERTKEYEKELKKRKKSVSGLYCQQGRCLHNASFSL